MCSQEDNSTLPEKPLLSHDFSQNLPHISGEKLCQVSCSSYSSPHAVEPSMFRTLAIQNALPTSSTQPRTGMVAKNCGLVSQINDDTGGLRHDVRNIHRHEMETNHEISLNSSPTYSPVTRKTTYGEIHQNTNQLILEEIKTPRLDDEEILDLDELARINNKSTYGLAQIKLGLHGQKETNPCWQYALLDSGCSTNLISLKALQAIYDFDKVKLTATTAKTIRCANNDQSQQIHGKVQLYLSMIDEENKRLCYRASFHVVSGLVHEIFLGQPFLTSLVIQKTTRDSLFFRNPNSRLPPSEVRKIYNIRRVAVNQKRKTLLPKTATKVETNYVSLPFCSEDTLVTFQPSKRFMTRYPSLHILDQTVQMDNKNPISISVVNMSNETINIRQLTAMGHFDTVNKTDVRIYSVEDFLSPESRNQISRTKYFAKKEAEVLKNLSCNLRETQYNSQTKEDLSHQSLEVNTAYAASMHDHQLTEEERRDRNRQYKNEGFFQKSVSELVEDSQNIPSFDYTGKDQFKPKTDEELLNEINLDHLTSEQRTKSLDMLKRNIDAFQRHPLDIGCCNAVEAFAPLNTKEVPILYAKYIPIPLKYKKAAQHLIDQYCAAGVLQPTTEPCKFTSNIFVIPKKDGTFRLIFDGRILSKYCQALPLALGNFDEIFADLTDKQYVSKMDVSKAYDQIRCSPETSKLLSFFGPNCQKYIYTRAGQGLKFSSFFLTQAMDKILFGMEGTRSYCDDIFVASSASFDDHLDRLEKVIKRFKKFNMKLSISKLEITPKSLDFLGLTWSLNKLSIPKSKITAYLNLKQPKSLKEA